jgi:hypothetical protein
LNFKSLSELSTKNLVKGLPKIKLPDRVYDKCITSKQPRTSFKTKALARAIGLLGGVY